MVTSRGFTGRRRTGVDAGRVPPGQYVTTDFPVLSTGPTRHLRPERWSFTIGGEVAEPQTWSWEQLHALPSETITTDIHCVTKWSKFDTTWTGVSLDTLLEGIRTDAHYVMVVAEGGYTTNLPLADIRRGQAWLVHTYEGAPLTAEHGGPVRLLVPHLYLWKSAKWVRRIDLHSDDNPGFWERYGYHNYGDPWREQRYTGD